MMIAKEDETEEMYQNNLTMLTPWLRDAVSSISEEEYNEKIEVSYNSDGLPVCKYHREGKSFHITSEHPIEEAEIWAQSIDPQDSSVIFLYGSGFGYALFELFSKKSTHNLVVVFEQDICLFKAMLHYFDLTPLIQTQKIMFFIGDSDFFDKVFVELFCSILFLVTTYPTVIYMYPATRNFKNEYLEIHNHVLKELSFLTSCIGNSHQDDMNGLRNLLANSAEVLKNPHVSCVKNKYCGVPAVIVSNGPSLDSSIPLLKEIQGKCLMICSESAIVPLTKNGIKPDILTALERTKLNYQYHFENKNHSPDISLFALALVDPRVFPSFKGEKIPVFRQGEELNRWFNQNLADGSSINAGSSVAHLAASIAIHLGADPIIFVGQDFAYGPEGATHSKDAVASNAQGKRVRDILNSLPIIYVEGNNGEMIATNQIWLNFRIGMESIISEHPEHLFYNATNGGAKIAGTRRAEFSSLIRQYCTGDIPYRVTELIAKEREKISPEESKVKLENMISEVEEHATVFRNLANETNRKKLESEKMMILCAGKDEEKYRELLDETYKRNTASFYEYSENALCRFFFQRLICAYFYLFDQLDPIDTQDKRAQIFDLHRRFFRDLRVVSQSLAVSLDEAACSLKITLGEMD